MPSLAMRGLKGIVLFLCCAVVLLPFVSVIATSLADQRQLNAAGGLVLWPDDPSFDAYRAIFGGGE